MHATLTMSSPDEQWHFELIQTPTHVYMKESDAPWIRTSIETAELPSSTFETDLFQGIFDDHEIPWEVVTVETLGWEEIGGVKAEHLQIQVDLLALMRAQLQEFREEVIGQEVPVDEMFAEILEEQAALLPEFDVEVWVDEQYIARKQSMRMAMGEEMTATIDAEIFDINEDIVIQLPPDYVESVGPLPIPDPFG